MAFKAAPDTYYRKSELLSEKVLYKPVTLELPQAHPRQFEFLELLKLPGIRFAVGACGTKFGKLIDINEVVPTTTGFKKIEDVKEGDYLFDADGKPTLVEYITDITTPEVSYKVTFSDGNTVNVCSEHLWETQTHACRKNLARVKSSKDRCKSTNYKPEVLTTQQIKDTLNIKLGNGKARPNHSIDLVTNPVQFPEQLLPLDPYVLGCWLGDGTSNNGSITCDDKEQSLLDNIRNLGFTIEDSKDPQRFNIVGLSKILRSINLINNKHIPDEYLIGSVEQRLSLLQGLMDTDGTIDTRGNCCFDNTNKNLALGVKHLAESLGIKVNLNSRIGKLYGVEKKLCYRVCFTTDLNVFRISRKLNRIRKVTSKSKRRYIVSIDRIPSIPMRCIRVDNPRHLFLVTKACIPTHNTYGTTAAIVRNAWDNEDSLNWWISPTFSQAKMAFGHVKKLLPMGTYNESKSDLKITIIKPNGADHSVIDFKSADNPDSLRGFAVNFFVMDEAARCPYDSWVSLFTTVTQTRGKGYIISTPKGRNWFYDVYQWGVKFDEGNTPIYEPGTDPHPEFTSIRMPTWANPHVPLEAIKTMKASMPEDVFRQEVSAQFLLDSAGVFKGISDCIKGELQPPMPGVRYVMGVDLARIRDYSVLTVMDRETKHVVWHERFNQMDWQTQYHKIISTAKKYNNALSVVDTTGIGDPIVENLKLAGIPVHPYKIGSNIAKAQLIDKLRVNIEQLKISYPKLPILIRELQSYEYEVSASGIVHYSAPSGMHDDCVISLALANWVADSQPFIYKFKQVRGI